MMKHLLLAAVAFTLVGCFGSGSKKDGAAEAGWSYSETANPMDDSKNFLLK
ncbi:MAG: hypothetical protein LBV18_05065 [Alistipes sp.]|jgi:hypothetical protein|nr:hypothetical protein [Alistipes sp.]